MQLSREIFFFSSFFKDSFLLCDPLPAKGAFYMPLAVFNALRMCRLYMEGKQFDILNRGAGQQMGR